MGDVRMVVNEQKRREGPNSEGLFKEFGIFPGDNRE